MSSLGGALSLYLGIAIATIFEVIELCFDFCGNIIGAGKGKRKREPKRVMKTRI